MTPSSWLEINLARLDHNLTLFRQLLDPASKPASAKPSEPSTSKPNDALATNVPVLPTLAGHSTTAPRPLRATPPLICGVIKADGYGLGATTLAKRLAARAIDLLAVYSPQQAAELVRDGITTPLMILMPVRDLSRTDPLYRPMVAGQLHLTIHDLPHLREVDAIAQQFGARPPIHLHVDTGMSRAGLTPEQLPDALDYVLKRRNLKLAGIYSHLATAGSDAELADHQAAVLDTALHAVKDRLGMEVAIHLANTAATLRDRRFHRSMVRIGLGLMGYGAEQFTDLEPRRRAASLQPIVRWLSRIVHKHAYAKGSFVGYNATHELKRDSVLGVVPVGYADGYPLALSNQARVTFPELTTALQAKVNTLPNDARPFASAPVLGQINMDQIVIDLTDHPQLEVGSVVELISDQPDSPAALPTLAKQSGASTYELLCRLSPRIPRCQIYSQQPHALANPQPIHASARALQSA